MFRTIDTAFWTDPKVKDLPSDGKLLFLYLITNPHTHVSGIYYLPTVVISHETGLSKTRLDTLWDSLSRLGFARRDQKTEVVWVVNMFRYQGKGEKNIISASSQLKILHNSPLCQQFAEIYPEVLQVKNGYRIGYGIQSSPAQGPQEQEQDKDKEQDKEEFSSEPPASPDNSEPKLRLADQIEPTETHCLVFPTVGAGPKTWGLCESKVREYQTSFPGIDVVSECRKAWQWCQDNPAKRKTARGMPAFLARWLSKVQDRGGGHSAGSGRTGTPSQDRDAAYVERRRRETAQVNQLFGEGSNG
jgi:hypothetical protein